MPRDAAPLPEAAASQEDEPTWREPLMGPPSTSPAPARLELMAGEVLADRFVIKGLAGSGGMGTIHRANDLSSGQPVAIKVLASQRRGDAQRFDQEVSLLAELSHPAIVRYVGHGETPLGTPFLAMEWLDGEDLAARLVRAPLTAAESLLVVRRAAQGMAVAHARGIVHRDLKPSNLFLVARDPAELKVLDFGIARHGDSSPLHTRPSTQPGMLLGTVGYMSPEQAMGPGDVDARTDVFALGCVLFECLTGQGAFVGSNAVAVLAKVIREDPPLVSELRPELGKDFDALVADLMAKEPARRPKDAAAVLRALEELGRISAEPRFATRPAVGLTGTELRIVSVILGRPRPKHRSGEMRRTTPAELARIQEVAQRFGAEPVPMRGGGLLVTLSGRGAATDQATQAATYALLLRSLRPDLCLVLATGRAETAGPIPVGAAIDRAAKLLTETTDPTRGVALDELSAGLLEPGFELRPEGERLWLVGQHVDLEATRLLMGKATPFMGRERELSLLELTLRQCVDDAVTRAVLVTGPPGQGKSRLRHEFVARAREVPGVKVVMAKADPVGAGSAFALVRQLVRDALEIREGDSAIAQQARVRARVDAIGSAQEAARMGDFLCELLGVPSSGRPGPELRAARSDPQIMGAWLERSFRQWLEAESASGALVIVLEDLHWGDLPSVTYLGEALRAPSMGAMMVLALSRPDVHDAFPRLWEGAEKIEIPLGRLTSRTAEALVREALGDDVEPGILARIVARADGNAFYLEELIRRVAEGDVQSLPETVVALVQTRLERLDADARRIVRAASVFGEVFWSGGVFEVLGALLSPTDVTLGIQKLVKLEVFAAAHESRFPRESEYRFRHDLLRDAAYAMLTDADRTRGHLLAGDWLERAGEKDALALADHFDRGSQRTRAVPWLFQAAQSALDGGNVAAAVSLGNRGIDCNPDNRERGRLRLVQATAFGRLGTWVECARAAREVMICLPVGTAAWFGGAGLSLFAGMSVGDPGVSAAVLQEILGVEYQPEPSGQYGFAVYCVCVALLHMGQGELAESFVRRAEDASVGQDRDPRFVMYVRLASGHLQCARGDLGDAMKSLAEARNLADSTNDPFGRAAAGVHSLQLYIELGQTERAERTVRKLSQIWASLGASLYTGWSTYMSAWSELNARRTASAVAAFRSLLDRDNFMAPTARGWLAHAHLAHGDLDDAEREATASFEATSMLPAAQAVALVALGLVELARGRPEQAVATIERAPDAGWPSNRATRRLAAAEALHAAGRTLDAATAIREARSRILGIADSLYDAELRESYLTAVAVNARTLALAEEWLRG